MWPFKKKKTERDIAIERIKNEPLDFADLFNNISNRGAVTALYKELCSVAHPDRFVSNPEKQLAADKIFKDIQANRYSYDGLLKIKESIKSLL